MEFIEEVWESILGLTSQFVIPDWGAMILLLPVILGIVILIVLFIVFRRLWRAPKPRRGKARIEPRTPAGIHMPGASYAPIFAAVGAFLFFLGIVFGGLILVLGTIALVITLGYWLKEALTVYDKDLGASAPALPAMIHEGPPPGVHMPGPSFRPFLGALGTFFLFLGLVFGGWLLALGVFALIATLVGWLIDARKEYTKTVEADSTGHLENIPAPRTPRRLLWTLGILFVLAILLQGGWIPPREATEAEAPPPSGEPGEPPASTPPGGPVASGEASGEAPSEAPTADVAIEASGIAFTTPSFTAPADTPFTIAFSNQDSGVPHNVEIKDPSGGVAFMGDVFSGVATQVYDVPALTAGDYTFLCTVHPNMTGTAKIG